MAMVKVGPAVMRLIHDDVSANSLCTTPPTVVFLVRSDALTSIVLVGISKH
jgi:hypothetical protein